MSDRRNITTIGLLILLVWAGSAAGVSAERYLTVPQVQKLCFPAADDFEEQEWRVTVADAKAIKQKSGVKVLADRQQIWLARQGGKVVGILVADQVLGKHELIDYAVALSPGGKVLQIEIMEYRESYGTEIRGTKWRAQFKGKTTASRVRLNDDVYNISGATISCRHVTEGVRRILAMYDLVGRSWLVAHSGVSASD